MQIPTLLVEIGGLALVAAVIFFLIALVNRPKKVVFSHMDDCPACGMPLVVRIFEKGQVNAHCVDCNFIEDFR